MDRWHEVDQDLEVRVVQALALRETRTRFGANQLGYLWALLEPLFWIGTFWGLFRVVDRHAPNGMEIIPFLATGIVPYHLVMKTAEKGSQAINGNKALLFYPQVQTLDLIFARGALELATYAAPPRPPRAQAARGAVPQGEEDGQGREDRRGERAEVGQVSRRVAGEVRARSSPMAAKRERDSVRDSST